MASVSTYKGKNGTYRAIQFIAADGKRRTVRLGKLSDRNAQSIKSHIEELNNASIYQQAPARRTAEWLADIDASLAEKLSDVGLIPRRESRCVVQLGEFLDEYTAKRVDVKPATKEVWSQVVRNLKAHFGERRDIATVNEGHAEEFKLYLIAEKLSPTTVHKRLQFARMFFRAARKQKVITENPFAEVSAKAVIDKDRQHYVSVEDTEKLLGLADMTWQTIIALARYAGLRCPSEVLSVRWIDVDWELDRIRVESPKTAHHPGKGSREIPIFALLRPYLDKAWDAAPKGTVYVVDERLRASSQGKSGWRNCNLRTQFERIIKRAKLEPWPRLFHALRSSCETDLAAEFPLHVVTGWLGNTPKVAMKHYLLARDADFERATKSAAESGAVDARSEVKREETSESPSDITDNRAGSCAILPLDASFTNGEDRSLLPQISNHLDARPQ